MIDLHAERSMNEQVFEKILRARKPKPVPKEREVCGQCAGLKIPISKRCKDCKQRYNREYWMKRRAQ